MFAFSRHLWDLGGKKLRYDRITDEDFLTSLWNDGCWSDLCQIEVGLREEETVPRAGGPSMPVSEQGFHFDKEKDSKLEKNRTNPHFTLVFFIIALRSFHNISGSRSLNDQV